MRRLLLLLAVLCGADLALGSNVAHRTNLPARALRQQRILGHSSFETDRQHVLQPMRVHRPPRLVIAGPPAAGKGTQCAFLAAHYGIVHLSTGDMLRAEISNETPLGLKIKGLISNGQLVSDDLIIELVHERITRSDCSSQGWLLDGFPRTLQQALALRHSGNEPDCVIFLDVPEDITIQRIVGRRLDPTTGKIYHLQSSPPENSTVSQRLVRRSDDCPDIARRRFKEFTAHVDMLRGFYADRLIAVDGTLAACEVSDRLETTLDRAVYAQISAYANC